MNASGLGSAAHGPTIVDPRAGLLDLRSAPIGYGYYAENATDAETIVLCHNGSRRSGWWSRHRRLRAAVGVGLAANLGFLPAVQDALLTALQHL
ncbi:hypothetical protein NDR87_26570 [Nocardia sp. CDC159]|uniref:Uncharacterized protein n=1 Tax=Nocardia pulmonis TaxID=2951408 RepID=A0A9X2EA05_9NOCA|nr:MULTISPECIES: hypothetical protein [Nocardia]MCM6777057.1 hypothetical protein [Nocardia pulmonis]MCM6789942.1 hypothetical protein [Nocardia sp. CDC159]